MFPHTKDACWDWVVPVTGWRGAKAEDFNAAEEPSSWDAPCSKLEEILEGDNALEYRGINYTLLSRVHGLCCLHTPFIQSSSR